MLKVIKFLEKMWLMLAAVTLVLAIYKSFTSTMEDALYFYIFCAVSVLLYFLRRRQRKNFIQPNDTDNNS